VIDQKGFILTRQWRDTRKGVELEFWLSSDDGPVKLLVPEQESVFFVPAEQVEAANHLLTPFSGINAKAVPLRDFSLQPVQAFYSKSQRTLREAKTVLLENGLSPLESDINPHDRFLMERFIRGSLRFRGEAVNGKFPIVQQAEMITEDYQPTLKVISLDIETAMQGINLYSIGIFASNGAAEFKKVFMVASEPVADNVEVFNNEKSLVIGFLIWLADYDPDIIIGWNVVNFDMWYLEKVCEKYQLPFRCGRGGEGRETKAHWRTLDDEGERRAVSIPGRVVLDGIELLKAAFYRFESFALNNVAKELLDDGKLIQGNDRGEKITDLFLENKQALAEYNIQDCKLVWEIFEHTKLLDFAIARTKMTGLPLERIGGSVASFDFRYLPLLHRQGFVAPNSHLLDDAEQSPGGFVMESRPGIYDHVAVLDFKSLYPSIIRSFKIDPLGMALGEHESLDQSELVPGFKGAWFSKKRNILPELIAELWQLRDQAKANNDAPLSQAIKIIMNSFYGVLGSGGCRFFDSR
jgi:DNA polymerase-2